MIKIGVYSKDSNQKRKLIKIQVKIVSIYYFMKLIVERVHNATDMGRYYYL